MTPAEQNWLSGLPGEMEIAQPESALFEQHLQRRSSSGASSPASDIEMASVQWRHGAMAWPFATWNSILKRSSRPFECRNAMWTHRICENLRPYYFWHPIFLKSRAAKFQIPVTIVNNNT